MAVIFSVSRFDVCHEAASQGEITAGNTLYTVGSGSTTFGVPDKRGWVSVMPDPIRLRITGVTFNSTTPGGVGGIERNILSTGNLPAYTPAGSVATTLSLVGTAPVEGSYPGTTIGGAAAVGTATGSPLTIPLSFTGSSASSTFTGDAQGGSSTVFTNVQPSLVTNCLLFAGA
jgi:microcystin-dependent protein